MLRCLWAQGKQCLFFSCNQITLFSKIWPTTNIHTAISSPRRWFSLKGKRHAEASRATIPSVTSPPSLGPGPVEKAAQTRASRSCPYNTALTHSPTCISTSSLSLYLSLPGPRLPFPMFSVSISEQQLCDRRDSTSLPKRRQILKDKRAFAGIDAWKQQPWLLELCKLFFQAQTQLWVSCT